MSCNCSADWRVELLDLASGVHQRFVDPTAWSFEQSLNQVGVGSVMIPVEAVRASDVWPRLRAVAFSRVSGLGATPSEPVCEYIGLIESMSASSEGSVVLGLQSIEGYLAHRIVEDLYLPHMVEQTEIGQVLASGGSLDNGIPLYATAAPSAFRLTQRYQPHEDRIRLEAVQQLTEIENGPDYILRHQPLTGARGWQTIMEFSDYAGDTSARHMHARRGMVSYSLSVDSDNHTNHLIGRGSSPYLSVENDSTANSIYPRFTKSQQWSELETEPALWRQVYGYVIGNRHPAVVPEMSVADVDFFSRFNLADHVQLKMDYGAVQYDGEARIIRRAISSEGDSPVTCTYGFTPVDDVRSAILDAPESKNGCCR